MKPKEAITSEKRAAFHRARAAVKLLPSTIFAWKIRDTISRLRSEVKGNLEDAVCTHQDWLEAVEAMIKLNFERMKVLSEVNWASKVSHEKLKESLVDNGVHDALANFLVHDTSFAKHARPGDHLGSWSSYMFGDLSRFVGGVFVEHDLSHHVAPFSVHPTRSISHSTTSR